MHRNVANLVLSTDFNCQSVITYAVVHLKVKHVMVVGHIGCGGVTYAVQNRNAGLINPLITHIDDVQRLHRAELRSLKGDELLSKVVEYNVYESCLNLLKNHEIQLAHRHTGFPKVHGRVYDMKTGRFSELKHNF